MSAKFCVQLLGGSRRAERRRQCLIFALLRLSRYHVDLQFFVNFGNGDEQGSVLKQWNEFNKHVSSLLKLWRCFHAVICWSCLRESAGAGTQPRVWGE